MSGPEGVESAFKLCKLDIVRLVGVDWRPFMVKYRNRH